MNRPRLLRRALGAAVLALAVPAAAAPAAAQVRWDNDVRVSYEIDDNVREEVSDALRARVARVSVQSDLVLDDSQVSRRHLLRWSWRWRPSAKGGKSRPRPGLTPRPLRPRLAEPGRVARFVGCRLLSTESTMPGGTS